MDRKIANKDILQRKVIIPYDEPFLKQLFFDVHSEDKIWLSLGREQRATLMEIQYTAQRNQYAQTFPNSKHQIIGFKGRDVGRVLLSETESEVLCVDIAILAEYRNQGIGGILIRNLIEESECSNRIFGLSVLKTNRAIGLYERLGIEITADEGIYWKMQRFPRRSVQLKNDDHEKN